MTNIKSEGVCNFCGETFSRQAMTRHLEACYEKTLLTQKDGRKQKTFWLSAQGADRPEYWIYFEAPATTLLANVDQFLRDIWLECCGHLSAFTIDKTRYELNTGQVDSMWNDFFGPSVPAKSMQARLFSVLKPGMTFRHEYDFGTTTELTLKVVAEKERIGGSRDFFILSRNNPPNIPCYKCQKPATQVCVECIYDGPQAWLCDAHVSKHKCGEDMFLPVVNSPRVGMCGYTGEVDF